MTDVREYLYWIGKNCSKAQLNVIYDNICAMTSHDGLTLSGPSGSDSPKLGEDFTLKYVFLSKFAENRASAMVYDGSFYYIIDNTMIDEVIKSSIWYHSCPISLVDGLPEDLFKYLGLKTVKQALANLSKKDREALDSVLPLDFVLASVDKRQEVWNSWVKTLTSVMDLSSFTDIEPSLICEQLSQIQTLVLNRNEQLTKSLSWLVNLPNLTVLTVWDAPISDDALVDIHKYADKLKIVEFHYCPYLTGRALLSLTKLPIIDKIVIDNVQCKLQETTFETVITDREWSTVKADTLTTLFVNSGNLTLDFIDFCLKRFTGLTNFIMHDLMLQKLEKNARSGHSDRKITFHSSTNIDSGFYRYADVKISDLVRFKIGPAFSEAMLRKIRELDPSKAALIDILESNETSVPL
jgi:hypothetical protein